MPTIWRWVELLSFSIQSLGALACCLSRRPTSAAHDFLAVARHTDGDVRTCEVGWMSPST